MSVRRTPFLAVLLLAPLVAQQFGLYQWVGAAPEDDLLTAAAERTAELGLSVFRFYLGARFDYQRAYLHPNRFAKLEQPATPAAILELPRYAAVLDDPRLAVIGLTVYEALDYGAGADDINLYRPFGRRERIAVEEQISELVRLLYNRWGDQPKTILLLNHETDEKLMDILNYNGGDAEAAIATLAAWINARQQAVERVRAERPDAQLQIYHGCEISVVNLKIADIGRRWAKSRREAGYSALDDITPLVRCDLISYSAYEATNSPYQTLNPDVDPAETGRRLLRDLDLIRKKTKGSISSAGRRRFGNEFVMIGELGFARERFEPLPTGGALSRFRSALGAASKWGCPYVVVWQVFDAPRFGEEAWGFGVFDRRGETPQLEGSTGTCRSLAECLAAAASDAE